MLENYERPFRIFALLVLAAPMAASAEVVVETFEEPISERFGAFPAAAAQAPSFVTKGIEPTETVWFIPFFKVDTEASAFGGSTFWSVRNEGGVGENVTVVADFLDTRFNSLGALGVNLVPRQISSNNVREVVEDFPVDTDGFARGLIRLTPSVGRPISVDVFQVDAENNFATGGPAFAFPDDFCTNWQVRFLSFGGLSGGSVMTVFVNGPRGLGSGNPPTVLGDVYNEAGAFINSFTIRTDEFAFEVELLDFVMGETSFGSIDLVLNAAAFPRGVVSAAHSALGRFSVGGRGICRDDL